MYKLVTLKNSYTYDTLYNELCKREWVCKGTPYIAKYGLGNLTNYAICFPKFCEQYQINIKMYTPSKPTNKILVDFDYPQDPDEDWAKSRGDAIVTGMVKGAIASPFGVFGNLLVHLVDTDKKEAKRLKEELAKELEASDL